METILIVTADRARLDAFAKALAADLACQVRWAGSGAEALASVKADAPLAAVIDEHLADTGGLDLVRRLLPINAMIHTALRSGLDPEAFHETSEGLGILAQLPLTPGAAEAQGLSGQLRAVQALWPAAPS